MSKSKLTICKACGAEIAKSAKSCPQCGAKNKQPFYKKWWFWVIIVILLSAMATSGKGENGKENSAQNHTTEKPSSNIATTSKHPAKTEYYVGDMIEDGNTKIVFMSSGDYAEDNNFMQPAEGKKYIYLQFAFENISSSADTSVSLYSFTCYADGYAADMYYGGEDSLSATLSAGRGTTGYIYFEVPENAQKIEVEYETNVFTEKKIKFIFEGQRDSGYVQELNAVPTEGAYNIGETAESSRLKITYLSCGEYVSDNMFVSPADGYHFITCEFEFENIGSSDEHISSFNFDCYADGTSCKANYYRDDNLSATLSAGRKVKGTVTFEVPTNANVVEVEYLSNYWTANRVVFNASN